MKTPQAGVCAKALSDMIEKITGVDHPTIRVRLMNSRRLIPAASTDDASSFLIPLFSPHGWAFGNGPVN